MTPQLISIYALVAMFVVATIWPINMGVLAFVGAFLVGTLVAGQETGAIIDGFPGGLFLTLVGITFLFALAQNNGTIDWLVRLAVRAVRGRIAAIPWIMFGISAVLTSVGAVSPGAVAIIAPIALGFAFRYQISPLLMGLMVVHGAQAGGFSPISIYGGITNGVVAEAGLPLSPMTTFGASFFVNAAVALILFLLLGGAQPAPRPVRRAGGNQRAAHRDHQAGHRPADLRRLRGRGAEPTDRPRGRGRAEPADRRSAAGVQGREPLPGRDACRARRARRPRPRLQARHRLRVADDRPASSP